MAAHTGTRNDETVLKPRRPTRPVTVGGLVIGGEAPISVQSMTSTKTEDVAATIAQIRRLETAGCELVRVAVPTEAAAEAIGEIKRAIRIPLVADIHFDYRLALRAIAQGADKIRINPGNIGSEDRIRRVLSAAKEKGVPIRVGVNGGSLEKDLLHRYGGVTAEALTESALRHVYLCEKFGFEAIVVSAKASDVPTMIATNRILSSRIPYPLHLGVTEAGTRRTGVVYSAVGIGVLLAEGIGDTIRVSLTGDPVEEVRVGFEILKSLGLRKKGVRIVSCPTCGRTEVPLEEIVREVESALESFDRSLTVAVMGCVVNGPGEAKEADIGVACGKGSALLFRRGEILRKIAPEEIVSAILSEVRSWREEP